MSQSASDSSPPPPVQFEIPLWVFRSGLPVEIKIPCAEYEISMQDRDRGNTKVFSEKDGLPVITVTRKDTVLDGEGHVHFKQ